MTTIEGHYFDGCHPIAVKARMDFMEREAVMTAESFSERFKSNHLKVSPRVGSTYRFVSLPNGGQFGCADNVLLDSIAQESQSEGITAWLEERWTVALACVAVISLILLVGYFWGLPAAAERIACRIPMETERPLGIQALTYMDEQGWFKPTNLGFDKREKIQDGFDRLCSDLPLNKYYHLEFRAGAIIGANAIAFPGGIIIITDEMVETAEEMEEVLAVLAHEMGHVELRHIMRSVLQNSAIGVIVATVTSDAASLSAAVTALPVILAQTKYSRDFETAADEYAFRLLKQKGYSPRAFATLMERIAMEHQEDRNPFAWISTHPVTSERVKRARDAAAD
ncbi:MAG: M48 family metallopeptidase [Desulfobacterales bacterium]|nr:MAG: M48 family metallopeptidase [Desulfobacterales bacterium]